MRGHTPHCCNHASGNAFQPSSFLSLTGGQRDAGCGSSGRATVNALASLVDSSNRQRDEERGDFRRVSVTRWQAMWTKRRCVAVTFAVTLACALGPWSAVMRWHASLVAPGPDVDAHTSVRMRGGVDVVVATETSTSRPERTNTSELFFSLRAQQMRARTPPQLALARFLGFIL